MWEPHLGTLKFGNENRDTARAEADTLNDDCLRRATLVGVGREVPSGFANISYCPKLMSLPIRGRKAVFGDEKGRFNNLYYPDVVARNTGARPTEDEVAPETRKQITGLLLGHSFVKLHRRSSVTLGSSKRCYASLSVVAPACTSEFGGRPAGVAGMEWDGVERETKVSPIHGGKDINECRRRGNIITGNRRGLKRLPAERCLARTMALGRSGLALAGLEIASTSRA